MAFNELIRKIEFIKEQTTDEDGQFAEDEETADDFTRLKKQIDRDIKSIRQKLDERRGMDASAEKAKKSSEIRKAIRGVREIAEQMDEMAQKQAKKMAKKVQCHISDPQKGKPKYEDEVKQSHIRVKLVELVWAHIKEVEKMEKKDFINADADFDDDAPPPASCTVTSLPKIDTPEGLLMQKNEEKIDALLDVLGAGVSESKAIALEMGKEADRQTGQLDGLNARTQKINEKLETYNEHLLEVIEENKSADKFCLNVVIVLIVLGLVGVFVSFFLKGF